MAFSVLLSLSQTIDQILKDERYPISVHGKQQIASMLQQVRSFVELLKEFPMGFSRLERRMREAANEAEDILEHFMYEQIRLRFRLSRAAAAGIKNPNPSSKEYDFDELKWVTKEMDSINGEVIAIKIGDLELTDSLAVPTVLPGHDNIVVGLHEDLLKIKAMLCGEPNKPNLVPIVGMAGIGKTTLARMVYNDPLILEYFEVRVWVTISHDYNIQNILRDLLHGLKDFEAKIFEESFGSMKERVRMSLMNRRYLIVLDDVYNTNIWNDLASTFPNSRGSQIMITTRLLDIGLVANYNHIHHMRFMSVDESWGLLQQKVFKNQAFKDELEKFGKEIAVKCGGLPLAIELIAGFLSERRTPALWKKIAENVSSVLYQLHDGQFEKIISLSYTHLPHHLRPCFLYMGGFPEDYEIHISKLIKLWIAEGFVIKSSSKSLEEVAEEYLKDLVNRSLVFVKRKKPNNQIKSCSIHDLVREFCKRKAEEENLERRLSIAHSDLKCLAKAYGSTIRSVICFEPRETLLDALRKMRLLRVLDVVDNNSHVFSLPAQLFELFHLRYLAFGCPIKIPPAISMLQNLQTLIIRSNSIEGEEYLPMEVWMIPQLRHLISFFHILPHPSQNVFALQHLQTLSVVKNFRCTRRISRWIPHLKKLGITFSNDTGSGTSELNNLVYLDQLEKLKLIWNGDSTTLAKVNLFYPKTLKKLTLSGWRQHWKHMKTIGSLPNLQVLKLRHYACQGNTWETTEKQFHRLEYLLIDESEIQDWITGYMHFPMLRCLVIHRCPLLGKIPNGIADSPCLELIEVGNGNQFLVESAKRVLEEQHDLGNYDLQVRFVHDQETSMVGDEFDGSKSKF